MSLQEYWRKRDFRKTAEPRGRVARSKGRALRFVVQKHAASHLHYDFRLEMDGVLKSWAVPKGPSLDPQVKRLAMHVEDHPLDYIDFEGVIPEGEYGGGTVMVWDHGTWEPEGDPAAAHAAGALKFQLFGRRLKGKWMLVRMGGARNADGKNWLLIKERDPAARPGSGAALTETQMRSVVSRRSMEGIARARDRVWRSNRKEASAPATDIKAPPPRGRRDSRVNAAMIAGARKAAMPAKPGAQLATLAAAAPPGDGWVHEVKFDGYRMLSRLDDGSVRMISRNGNDWTAKFTAIVAALQDLPVRSAILDGEVVHLTPEGVSSFSALKADLSEGRTDRMVYYVFDLLYLDGYALTGARLDHRKEALAAILGESENGYLRYSEHIHGKGDAFYRSACELGLEGVVSKRCDAPYRAGRIGSWVKVKCLGRDGFAIIGWTDPAGSRVAIGALLLGYYDPQGILHYAGRVGTGFTAKTLRALHARLKSLATAERPFPQKIADVPRGAHWVEPKLVAEIRYSEWTPDGRLRHPAYLGLREDKKGADVVMDPPSGNAPARAKATNAIATPSPKEPSNIVAGVALSNPDKVLYPEAGYTKRDLALYYLGVAERMLPHVRGRPLTLVRCPNGRTGKCFYQKHDAHAPDPLHRIEITENDGSSATYLIADDAAGLVSLVQMGVLEIHVWGSTRRDIERPDRIVIDLDPDEGLPWQRVVDAAVMIRGLLQQLGLRSFVKGTGGKGLHVVIPFEPRHGWEAVKGFAKAIADALVMHDPSRFTASLSKRDRRGKIFVDYLRNQRNATAIAPYSVRAKPGAPVAVPLTWAEVESGVRSDAFTLATLPKRLAKLRADPWHELSSVRQRLPI